MSANLTNSELIRRVAEKTGRANKDVSEVLDGLVEAMSDALAEGQGVTMPGLVKLTVKDRPARQVRNPATGEMMEKAADRALKATPLKAIKDKLNA